MGEDLCAGIVLDMLANLLQPQNVLKIYVDNRYWVKLIKDIVYLGGHIP